MSTVDANANVLGLLNKQDYKSLELYNLNCTEVNDRNVMYLLLSSNSLLAIKFKIWVVEECVKQHCKDTSTTEVQNLHRIVNENTVKANNVDILKMFAKKSGVFFEFSQYNINNSKIEFNIKSVEMLEDTPDCNIIEFFDVFYFKEFENFLKDAQILKDVFASNVYSCDIFTYIKILEFANKHKDFYKEKIDEPTQMKITPVKTAHGSKVQKYTVDGQLVKTYNSILDIIRSEDSTVINETSIKNAIRSSKAYNGFRWIYLSREFPDETLQVIGETITSKNNTKDFIAMLDLDKTKIVEVFPDQKTACSKRQLKSIGAINNALKNDSICSGHYFNYFKACEQSLQDAYLETNKLPEKNIPTNCHQIEQVDPITSAIVNTYSSLFDAQKTCHISRQSLVKACKTGELLKGYKWILK